MPNWRDDHGRVELERLGDRELRRVYRAEFPPVDGKDRAYIIDAICGRRSEREKAKGDYRSKYQGLVPQVKRLEKRAGDAEAKVAELEAELSRAEVERRHAVELADALLLRMDKMRKEIEKMPTTYDMDLYAPYADDDHPLACTVPCKVDDEKDWNIEEDGFGDEEDEDDE